MKSGIMLILFGLLASSYLLFDWKSKSWGLGLFYGIALILLLIGWYMERGTGRKELNSWRDIIVAIGPITLFWVAYWVIKYFWDETVAYWAVTISFIVAGLVFIVHSVKFSQKIASTRFQEPTS